MTSKPTKTWRVMNLALALDEPESALRDRAARAAGVEPARVRGFRIARKSVTPGGAGGGVSSGSSSTPTSFSTPTRAAGGSGPPRRAGA